MTRPIITLTTDFGYSDEYVGVMKGVILGRAPEAVIVDITHGISPQNVRQAAFLLSATWPYFPARTIHVAVVDPGVGSERRIILAMAGEAFFLAPDNGLLTPILATPGCKWVRIVDAHQLYLQPLSSTFHGRDIFAPVAAALATGLNPDRIGPHVQQVDLTTIAYKPARLLPGETGIQGTVLFADHFGNLVTDITRDAVEDLLRTAAAIAPATGRDDTIGNPRRLEDLVITIAGRRIHGISQTYADGPTGELLALFGSRGHLEICVAGASAAQILKPPATAAVVISLTSRPD